jgi:hypothetical protein
MMNISRSAKSAKVPIISLLASTRPSNGGMVGSHHLAVIASTAAAPATISSATPRLLANLSRDRLAGELERRGIGSSLGPVIRLLPWRVRPGHLFDKPPDVLRGLRNRPPLLPLREVIHIVGQGEQNLQDVG